MEEDCLRSRKTDPNSR